MSMHDEAAHALMLDPKYTSIQKAYIGITVFRGIVTLIVIVIILIIFVVGRHKPAGYLDYMPTAIEPCPSHYRCGATTREQIAMENRLYANLRESEKYSLPATLTSDMISVVATDSEPTSCMMARAARATEGPKPEGMDNTWESIDRDFEFKGRRPGPKIAPPNAYALARS